MQKILGGLTLVLVLFVFCAWGLASYESNHAAALQAQAALTATRTNAGVTWALVGIIAVLGCGGLALGAGYLYLRLRQLPPAQPARKWLPGPNAGFRQAVESPAGQTALPDLNTLLQLEMLATLRQLRAPSAVTLPALPVSNEDWTL